VQEGYPVAGAPLPQLHEVDGRAADTMEGSQMRNGLESRKVSACSDIGFHGEM
jgi:hypothetical protein